MSKTIIDSAWDIYKYMHPDASQDRKEQLVEFLRNCKETRPDDILRLALAHLMTLDLHER